MSQINGKLDVAAFSALVGEQREWCIKDYCPPSKRCIEEFWAPRPKLREYIDVNAVPLTSFLAQFHEFHMSMKEKYGHVEYIAKPAAYDWQWLTNLYLGHFPNADPKFPFKAHCISTQWATVSEILFEDHVERLNAEIDKSPLKPDTHHALDDAIYQAFTFLMLKKESKSHKNYTKATVECYTATVSCYYSLLDN